MLSDPTPALLVGLSAEEAAACVGYVFGGGLDIDGMRATEMMLATMPDCPPALRARLLRSSPEVQRRMAIRLDLTDAEQQGLLLGRDFEALAFLAENIALTTATARALWANGDWKQWGGEAPYMGIVQGLATNPRTPLDILMAIAADPEFGAEYWQPFVVAQLERRTADAWAAISPDEWAQALHLAPASLRSLLFTKGCVHAEARADDPAPSRGRTFRATRRAARPKRG